MKFTASSFALFAAVANANVLGRAVCNADGCARAVTGTAITIPLSSRIADCSSFQRTTVTPSVSTITEQAASVVTEISRTTSTTAAVTVTTYVPFSAPSAAKRSEDDDNPIKSWIPTVTKAPRAVLERAAAPTVPAYAASCSGAVRYASACSCYGITSAVTTLPTPLTTTTTTSTTTSTVTVSETQPTVVVTVEVCNPATDYDYKYYSASPRGTYTIDTPAVDRAACCLACYTGSNGLCSAYAFGSFCQIVRVNQGDLTASDTCPRGLNTIVGSAGTGRVGVGPCGVGSP